MLLLSIAIAGCRLSGSGLEVIPHMYLGTSIGLLSVIRHLIIWIRPGALEETFLNSPGSKKKIEVYDFATKVCHGLDVLFTIFISEILFPFFFFFF